MAVFTFSDEKKLAFAETNNKNDLPSAKNQYLPSQGFLISIKSITILEMTFVLSVPLTFTAAFIFRSPEGSLAFLTKKQEYVNVLHHRKVYNGTFYYSCFVK